MSRMPDHEAWQSVIGALWVAGVLNSPGPQCPFCLHTMPVEAQDKGRRGWVLITDACHHAESCVCRPIEAPASHGIWKCCDCGWIVEPSEIVSGDMRFPDVWKCNKCGVWTRAQDNPALKAGEDPPSHPAQEAPKEAPPPSESST